MEFAIKIFSAVLLNLLENFYGSFQLENIYYPPVRAGRLFDQRVVPLPSQA
jgi:hypothetical protein